MPPNVVLGGCAVGAAPCRCGAAAGQVAQLHELHLVSYHLTNVRTLSWHARLCQLSLLTLTVLNYNMRAGLRLPSDGCWDPVG